MVLHAIEQALVMAGMMGWTILWPLILGFGISGAIQAVVSHGRMSRLLPDDSPKTLAIACGLGAASSSCSYAATALARTIFRKGGNFTAAMVFEIASTNLVLEIGLVILFILGWQFMAAEFVGAPIMIALLAILFRRFLSKRLLKSAKEQSEKGIAGKMEGHAAMDDMAVGGSRSLWQKLRSPQGRTALSHYFVMDWASIWVDIVGGLLIAGALAAWVPQGFWQALFLTDHPTWAAVIGPLVGPLIAIVSFVCSVGNIPLEAVLYAGGLSFGGVVSFILADLIIIPIIRIYAKYYGWKMAAFLSATFYVAMAGAGYVIEIVFGALRWVPAAHTTQVLAHGITWNYTTILNIIFLLVGAALVWRFLRTGGPMMLKMMNQKPAHHDTHAHHCAG